MLTLSCTQILNTEDLTQILGTPQGAPLYFLLLYSLLLYSTLSTLLYSTLLYSTLLYSTRLYSTLLDSTLLPLTLLGALLPRRPLLIDPPRSGGKGFLLLMSSPTVTPEDNIKKLLNREQDFVPPREADAHAREYSTTHGCAVPVDALLPPPPPPSPTLYLSTSRAHLLVADLSDAPACDASSLLGHGWRRCDVMTCFLQLCCLLTFCTFLEWPS